MDWQARYYPLDLFPGLSEKIGSLIASDQFKAVDLVHEEIEAVAPPGLKTWAATSNIFVPLVPEIQAEGAAIEALYPDLADPKGIYQSADAYLIASACETRKRDCALAGNFCARKAEREEETFHSRCMPRSRCAVH